MNTSRKTLLISSILVLILISIATTVIPAALAKETTPAMETLDFDVAEDMYRFVFDADVAFEEDGFPTHGSSFITQGYIYPYGTLSCDENGCNGVNADGSPEFPDKVLGEWTCRGFFVGEGAHSTTGAWVITTQLYGFGDNIGETTLVTEGYEIADMNKLVTRAITGGTGRYAGATGQGSQEFLGFNATEGVTLRFKLNITK